MPSDWEWGCKTQRSISSDHKMPLKTIRLSVISRNAIQIKQSEVIVARKLLVRLNQDYDNKRGKVVASSVTPGINVCKH